MRPRGRFKCKNNALVTYIKIILTTYLYSYGVLPDGYRIPLYSYRILQAIERSTSLYDRHPATSLYDFNLTLSPCGLLDQSDLRTDLGAYLVGVADDAHFSALRILKVGER